MLPWQKDSTSEEPENRVMLWQPAELCRPHKATFDQAAWRHRAARGGAETWKQCPEPAWPQSISALTVLPWMLRLLPCWHRHWNDLQKRDKQVKNNRHVAREVCINGQVYLSYRTKQSVSRRLLNGIRRTKSRHSKNNILFNYIYAKVKQTKLLIWRKLHFHWKNKAAGKCQCYCFSFT